MSKENVQILLVEQTGHILLIYGEWYASGNKYRGLLCKIKCIDGFFLLCSPHTGVPSSIHTSVNSVKRHLVASR